VRVSDFVVALRIAPPRAVARSPVKMRELERQTRNGVSGGLGRKRASGSKLLKPDPPAKSGSRQIDRACVVADDGATPAMGVAQSAKSSSESFASSREEER
jgi:hypothetical protein